MHIPLIVYGDSLSIVLTKDAAQMNEKELTKKYYMHRQSVTYCMLCYVLDRVYLLFDLRLVNKFSKQVELSKNVSISCALQATLRSTRSIVVIKHVIEFSVSEITPSSLINLCIQTASLAVSLRVTYSTSIVGSTIVSCLKLFQLTAPPYLTLT